MAALLRSGIAATVQVDCECRLLFRKALSSLQAEALYDRLQYIACNTSPKWGGGEGCCALSTPGRRAWVRARPTSVSPSQADERGSEDISSCSRQSLSDRIRAAERVKKTPPRCFPFVFPTLVFEKADVEFFPNDTFEKIGKNN